MKTYIRGLTLQPGADCEVSFVSPGRRDLVTTSSVVVHQQRERVVPAIGVAFRGAGLEYRLAPVTSWTSALGR